MKEDLPYLCENCHESFDRPMKIAEGDEENIILVCPFCALENFRAKFPRVQFNSGESP